MKVIFKRPIVERLHRVIHKAETKKLKIKKIILTSDELAELKDSSVQYVRQAHLPHIITFYGIKIEEQK
jgi:hypothetical protein